MVDTPLACLVVDVKVLKVVVEVHTSSTQVSSEQSCMCGEDGSDVDMSLPAQWNGETSLPFVEMGDDRFVGLSACELKYINSDYPIVYGVLAQIAYLAEEPCDDVTKDDGLVGFVVIWRGRDAGQVPKISLPLIHPALQLLPTLKRW